ncbi:MAG TPA: cell division protein FtsA [Bacillota bacterium]|nr:cell division protein FtsA [Bacillota bacterium]HOB86896.1 cell division protein FtsA [Bacillota bacterium]HOP69152.1 cell division protein FtsA [Bacillota bacterium]HPT33792.1 cell division protein FtsA [Bacillota bacterium]HPZ64333.1 cell division protein FtsA [Bacillota bacterium]
MARNNFIVGMDVGTYQVRVIVGEPRPDGTISVVGLGLSPSEGMKKGVIVDLEKTVNSIVSAAEEAERMVGTKIDSAYVGFSGLNIELINNRGVVAVSSEDREIRPEDVERVLQAARVIALPSDREIVDIIPREYIVDGYSDIRDPIGMLGVRLEVDAMIISSPITSLRNLVRCVNNAGLEVKGLILQALAAAEASLSPDEKELGVFLVDMGGGTTEISFFQKGKLQSLAVLPIGGDHITNDLAVGLRTSFAAAENLKIEHGWAAAHKAGDAEEIEVYTVGGKEKRLVSEREISRFIEPRIQEILQITREEMIKMGWPQLPPAGVVLGGGVSATRGLLELAGECLGREEQVRLAEINYAGIQNPGYAAAVGLINYIYRYQPKQYAPSSSRPAQRREQRSLWQRIKDWLDDFME